MVCTHCVVFRFKFFLCIFGGWSFETPERVECEFLRFVVAVFGASLERWSKKTVLVVDFLKAKINTNRIIYFR